VQSTNHEPKKNHKKKNNIRAKNTPFQNALEKKNRHEYRMCPKVLRKKRKKTHPFRTFRTHWKKK